MMEINNLNAQKSETSWIRLQPIGLFHTDFNPGTGAPRQGSLVPESKGSIELYPEYRQALKDLDLFEYIIVLYYFSEVRGWEPVVHPPASDHRHDFGLFATRTPKRPNPIGFSIVKLEKIRDGMLTVSGVDAFDGTPILDIKPYLPSIDCIKSVQNEKTEKKLGHHDEDFINDPGYYY